MQKLMTILLLYVNVQCYAQKSLTLQEAINIGLQNNLDIRIARNNLEAALVNNDLSVAGGMPLVTGTSSYNTSLTNLSQSLNNGTKIDKNNVRNSNVAAAVVGNFLLFNGFRVHATKARLQALEQQNQLMVNAQIQNLIATVMIRYYDIVRQQGYLKTINEAMNVTLQRKRLIEIKQSVGLANNTDRFQAEIDSTANVQDLRSQQLILDQSKADLMNLLLQRPDSIFSISEDILVDSSVNLDSVNSRLKFNPDLLSLEKQVRINELISKEIGAQRYPSLSVNGGYNFSRNQNGAGFTLANQVYGPFVGLGLSVPIFNGGLFKRQQKVAEIDTRNARYLQQKLMNDLKTSALKQYQAYTNALLQLRTETTNNKTSADLLDLVNKRYELGVGTILELREAQKSFVDAGFRLVNAAYAAKVAEITLKQLQSTLTP